jgi:hypothetical protein
LEGEEVGGFCRLFVVGFVGAWPPKFVVVVSLDCCCNPVDVGSVVRACWRPLVVF